ncbi:unnamed protein product [Rhizoctonia solani]|uniref:Uncharacterized protein n=1 Tax=Rhizoctonia solani TaxID=456999 RepID=A0A8H3CE19_9AGAM|nr:unnamed protein product [Rhizoctonia solani]CAE6524694.1 unnamed protein product [Rhizoctonia solani]
MVKTLDLDLRPGLGAGPFELGASLFDVLNFLRQPSPPAFPSVSVKYDTTSPAASPIILHLRPHIDLLFTQQTQRLHTISLSLHRNNQQHIPLVLSYKDEVLSGPDVAPHRTAVQRMMGPTYKGERMRYPGVWFSFEDDVPGATGVPNTAEGNAEVKRVVVTQRQEQSEHDNEEHFEEVVPNPTMYGDIKKAVIKIHDGIYLHFFTPEPEDPPIHIRLGVTTAEDLTCDLGPPVLTHYKEDDRMSIHATGQDDEESYFYNYFQHGMDFLISGKTHRVRKIIVHSNVPGSPLFQRYKRCPWEFSLSFQNAARPSHPIEPGTTPPTATDLDSSVPKIGKKNKIKKKTESERPRTSFEVYDNTPNDSQETVAFYDTIDILKSKLGQGSRHSAQPSMQLERTADLPQNELLTLSNSTTHLYAFDGVFCEASELGDVLCVGLF